jgi:hypothetical protein
MRRAAGILLGLAALAFTAPALAAPPVWQKVATIPGIFDIGGPRRDGSLVVAGAGRLYLVDPHGAVTPYPTGYADDAGAEAYLAVSPGIHMAHPGCDFQADDVFILRLHAPLGITRVDRLGQKTAFATIPGVQSLNGIAFDTVGLFGHRLLVTGASAGKTLVAAVDCLGAVSVITRTAPVVEGGLAVAPMSFGAFGGDLIAPDELSGKIYAVSPNGTASEVVQSGLPKGGDIGVEGVGFVPSRFTEGGGGVYYADRLTPGNPHPGTDFLLQLPAGVVVGVGVREGDLLAVTEGGTLLIGVRCDTACTVTPVISTPTIAHGEGHLVFQAPRSAPSSPSPSASPSAGRTPAGASVAQPSSPPPPIAALIAVLLVLGAAGLVAWRVRRARRP